MDEPEVELLMQTTTDRAAEVIGRHAGYNPAGVVAQGIAVHLADAELLVTDEMQALLDAAVEWVRSDMNYSSYMERCRAHFELRQAVRGFKPEVIPPVGP